MATYSVLLIGGTVLTEADIKTLLDRVGIQAQPAKNPAEADVLFVSPENLGGIGHAKTVFVVTQNEKPLTKEQDRQVERLLKIPGVGAVNTISQSQLISTVNSLRYLRALLITPISKNGLAI